MARSVFSGNLSGGFSLSTLNNQFGSLFQGDSSPLRPRAQAVPNLTIAVSASLVESYYSPIWLLGTAPLNYAGGNSSAVSAPSANRIDLLYITSGGTLTWITGAEHASPTAPSLTADGFPICYVYCKSTMTKIVNYEDKDANPDEGYIWKDVRALGFFRRLVATLNGGTGQDWSAVVQGSIPYFSATGVLSTLAPSTADKLLATKGAGQNPAWIDALKSGDAAGGDLDGTYPNPIVKAFIGGKSALYYQPDSSCIIAFNHGSSGADLASPHNAITLTSLTDTDLVAGKVSPLCYNFDGAADYALIAHHDNQAGMPALTMECWINADAFTGTDWIIENVANAYIRLSLSSTLIAGRISTSAGAEGWADIVHGISTGAWVYIVVAWDNTGKAQVYVNAVLKGQGDDAGNGIVLDSASGINIGADSDGGSNFDGKIDGVRILRRKMSAAEVLARYNAFK